MAYVINRAFWFHSPCIVVPSHLIYCTLDHIMRYIHGSTRHPLSTRHNHPSKMAEVPNNFVLLNDDNIAELIDASDATSTKKQIKFAVRWLESYAKWYFFGSSRSLRRCRTWPVFVAILWRSKERQQSIVYKEVQSTDKDLRGCTKQITCIGENIFIGERWNVPFNSTLPRWMEHSATCWMEHFIFQLTNIHYLYTNHCHNRTLQYTALLSYLVSTIQVMSWIWKYCDHAQYKGLHKHDNYCDSSHCKGSYYPPLNSPLSGTASSTGSGIVTKANMSGLAWTMRSKVIRFMVRLNSMLISFSNVWM